MPPERPEPGLEFESTIVQSPVAAVSRPGSPAAEPRTRSGSVVGTPEAALEQDDLDRSRIFLRLTMLMVFGLIAPLPFMGGDPIAKGIMGASAVAVGIVGTWFLWVLREPATRYAEWKKILVGAFCSGCGCSAVYYWGIFSPASAALVFGVYFVTPQGTLRSGLVAYGQCALFQGVLAIGIQTGLLIDRGVIKGGHLGTLDFIVLEATVQGILLGSLFFARATRATALHAIGQLERTVRDVARREALLLEARHDLARALRVGEPGRYTDQTLGSFALGVLIGHGGMGEVYEARHAATGEVAAVKLLHRHLLVDADHVARFVREARVVASLRSAHVVRVIEVSDETSPVPYLAMERLVGRDLADVLRDQPRLDLRAARDLVTQIARGVASAHAVGVVHRDLKPQNVFRSEDDGGRPIWKVLDFGLSKLNDQTANLTRGQIIGTPAYMAPEQARGVAVDARADVYALAAIAYRALTGQPPFHGTDMMALVFDVVSRMPVRPRLLAKDVSEDVERVLLVGMAKDPADRFATVGELATALEAAVAGKLDGASIARAAALSAKQPWSGPVEPPVG